jgi:tetratricopeptide (TPR) repeat protein
LLDNFQKLSDQEKQELGTLVTFLLKQRPNWHGALVLSGRRQELLGEKQLAARSYRLALQAGNPHLSTVLRLVSLLSDLGDFKEAEQIMLWLRSNDRRLGPGNRSSRIHPLAALRLHAELLIRQGRDAEVYEIVDEFARERVVPSDKEGTTQLYSQIAALYTSLKMDRAAELWLRRLYNLAPDQFGPLARNLASQGRVDDALKVCVGSAKGDSTPKAARTAAEILASHHGSPATNLERAHDLITDAVLEFDKDVPLLVSAAVYLAGRDETDESIRLFRRVVDVEPNHIVAINNLATLLGESEASRSEAREIVEKALQTAGRAPALLDTLGTIHLRAGDFEQAQKCLEEAIAKGGADPRHHFHLAAALYRLGRLAEAETSLQVALQGGLAQRLLTTPDKQLLTELQTAISAKEPAP